MRCFIAINLPDDVRQKVEQVQEKLAGLFKGKFTKLEHLHLTLKFLGEIDEEQVEEVKKQLGEVEQDRVEAKLDKAGVFSPKFVKIIWLKVLGLDSLQQEIDEKLAGMFPKENRFMSHLTIARVKQVSDRQRLLEEAEKIKLQDSFIVDRFYLIESILQPDGLVYNILAEYKLA
ncbi:MAG: RNA 2',3'-cyclic phosphodiesterase [Candidatus Nanoarchaeia archaeon]